MRRTRERGTVAVESSFSLYVLLFFLLVSPAIWKMWINENIARHEAERDTFRMTQSFLDLSQYTTPIGQILAGDFMALLFSKQPEAADIDLLDLGDDVEGWEDLPNKVVVGTGKRTVFYGTGWKEFQGTFDIQRNAYTLRPTWTWHGYPIVHTQDLLEQGDIEDWMTDAYEDTLDSSAVDALKLDSDPF